MRISDEIMSWLEDEKSRFIYKKRAEFYETGNCGRNVLNRLESGGMIGQVAGIADTTLYFNELGNGCSCITKQKTPNAIKAVSLDQSVLDKVTFIKMDIEGAELEALKGGKGIIKKYRPKLAISIYHKREDLMEIPRYIKSLVPEYRMYIRHYSNYTAETVLYAVI